MKFDVKRIKKIIIILAILLVTIIVASIIRKVRAKKLSTDFSRDSELVEDTVNENANKLIYEDNKNTYYTVINIIENYINNYDSAAVLDMLDPNYAKQYKINDENVIQIKDEIDYENENFKIVYKNYEAEKMYSVSDKIKTVHFVYGYYYNANNELEKEPLNLMLELDNVNQTFNIYRYEYMVDKKYNELKAGDSFKVNTDEIKNRNGNNTYTYVTISQEEMAYKYLYDYKNKMVFDTDNAYESLDKEYREKRFRGLDDFKEYVEINKVKIFTSKLEEYKVYSTEDGKNIYTCKDQNDNYYYFQETNGIMNYTAIIDNYTIDSKEFKETYDSSKEQERVILNIDRIRQAFNAKDYRYVYNKLSDGFKQRYYNSEEAFENYISSVIYDINDIQYGNFSYEGNTFIYDIVIKNGENVQEQTNMQILMQLKDNRDFVMSFNIK